MKNLLTLALCLLITAAAMAQQTNADILKVKKELWLGGIQLTSISTDTTLASATNLQIPTAAAVKSYARKLGGRPVSTTAPTLGEIMKWDGSKWGPATDGGAGTSISDFISGGFGNPPSDAASAHGGATYRNMTTGELWRSNGTAWILAGDRNLKTYSVREYSVYAGMTKEQAFTFLAAFYSGRGGFILLDTTVNITASTTVTPDIHIVRNGLFNISNTFTLTINGALQAPPRQQIFNTNSSGNVAFGQKAVTAVLPYWFGAVADNSTDCYPAIQKAVDVAIASSIKRVQFFEGYHNISKGILIRHPSTTTTLEFLGVKSYDAANGTVLLCTDSTNFAVAVQGARAVTIKGFYFRGFNASYNPTLTQIINNTAAQWRAQYGRVSRYSPFSGLVIDPFTNSAQPDGGYPGFTAQYAIGQGFSSNVIIEDCLFRYFPVGICFSPTTANGNGSEIAVQNVIIDRCRFGITTGNTQARDIQVIKSNIASVEVCMDGQTFGNQQGPMPISNNCQFGNCKDILRFGATLGDGKISNMYGESVYRIGRWDGPGAVLNLQNCEINFTTGPETGICDAASVLDANAGKINYMGGTISYSTYRPIEMNVNNILFTGTYIRSPVVNNPNGGTQENRVHYKNCKFDGYLGQDHFNYFEDWVAASDLGQVVGNYVLQDQTVTYNEVGTNNLNPVVYRQQNNATKNIVLIDAPAGSVVVDTVARTATFTTTVPGKYKLGDILTAYNLNSTATPSSASKATTWGIVSSVSGTTITCSHISRGISTGSYLIYLFDFKRFVPTCIANITSGSNKVVITSKPTCCSVASIWPVGTRVATDPANGSYSYGLYSGLYVASVTADTLFLSGNVGATLSGLEIFSADMRATYYSTDNTYQNGGATFKTVGYRTGDKIEFKNHAYRSGATVTVGGFTPTVKMGFKPISGSTGARPTPESVDVGLEYFNTTTGTVQWWDGAAWHEAAAAVNTAAPVSGDGSVATPITIATGAIQTVHLAASLIDSTKLAASSVQSTDIRDGQVWRVDIATNAVDSTKLATGAVTGRVILDGAITAADIAATGASAGTYTNPSVTVNTKGQVTAISSGGTPITGTGAAKQIGVFTGGSTQAGYNHLWYDPSIKKMGLGTNNPPAQLTIAYMGTGTEQQRGLTLQDSSSTGAPIWHFVPGHPGYFDGYFTLIRNTTLCQTIEPDGSVAYFQNLRINEGKIFGPIQHSNSYFAFEDAAFFNRRAFHVKHWYDFMVENGFSRYGQINKFNGTSVFGPVIGATNYMEQASRARLGVVSLSSVSLGSITSSGTTVTITAANQGGTFAAEYVAVGDEVTVSSQTRTVTAVSTWPGMTFTISSAFSPDVSSATNCTYRKMQLFAAYSESDVRKFTVRDDGKVAVNCGTLDPGINMEVNGSVAATAVGVENIFNIQRPTNAGNSYPQVATFSLGRHVTNGSFLPRTRLDVSLKNDNNNTMLGNRTVMSWLDNGFVGIGTVLPVHFLHTAGVIQTDSFLLIVGTQATGAKWSIQNTTASTGRTWEFLSRNDGQAHLTRSGITGTITKWIGTSFINWGYGRFGAAVSSLDGAILAATDSLATAAIGAVENKMSGSGASAYQQIKTASGGGDAFVLFTPGAVDAGYIGADISDGSAVKIGTGSVPGSNVGIKMVGQHVAIGSDVTPTAVLNVAPGSTTVPPVQLASGTLNTTALAGAVEYNGSHYKTKASALRFAEGGVIADHYTDAANTGTGETDLYSYTTPAATLAAAGQKITAQYGGIFTDLTATATLRVYFGGTNIFDSGAATLTGATGSWSLSVTIIETSSSTVRCVVVATAPGATTINTTSQTDVGGLTLSGTNILKITAIAGGGGGGSGDIVAKLGTVNWQGAAAN